MDVDYVSGDDEVLSRDAIIGIAVSSVVAGIAIVVAWIAVVCCCCVLKSKKKRTVTSSGKLDFKYVNPPCIPLSRSLYHFPLPL